MSCHDHNVCKLESFYSLLLAAAAAAAAAAASRSAALSSPTRFSLAVRLLSLNNAHNKLFVPLGGLPGPFSFMLTTVTNFA